MKSDSGDSQVAPYTGHILEALDQLAALDLRMRHDLRYRKDTSGGNAGIVEQLFPFRGTFRLQRLFQNLAQLLAISDAGIALGEARIGFEFRPADHLAQSLVMFILVIHNVEQAVAG